MIHKTVYRHITVMEAVAIFIGSSFGIGILALPRMAVEAADTGAPLLTLCGLCLTLFGALLITLLARRFPNDTVVRAGERVIGKWPARLMGVCLAVFFILLTALGAREFTTVVAVAVLPRTPVEATTLVMLLLAASSVRNNFTSFAYIQLFYQPFLFIPSVLIPTLALKNAIFTNLLPLWGNGEGHWWAGMASVAALLQGGFVLGFLVPAMIEPRRMPQVLLWGGIFIGSVYLLFVIASLAVFGSMEIRNLMWPTLEMAKITMLPGEVLERLDAAFLAIWVTAAFAGLYTTYFIASLVIKDVLRFEDHAFLSWALLPFIFMAAMLPPNVVQVYRAMEWLGRIGLVLTIGYPLILLAVAWMRGVREERGLPEQADSTL
ncbi:GerAB/ArcD/ProY family transporter [Alicyclobacillus shizuokensis]|uniref:GerAB/ArcD/ProY family transporter n=1 Tax=Alicyclobacillus shizuokensis TaxID=392014 RepID=UPI000AE4260F|nr:endospore germination permease [Alicyclobacillus shizuokensis]MCL6627236.1 spore germination protein [Alicyclobacillus shizuokensis]